MIFLSECCQATGDKFYTFPLVRWISDGENVKMSHRDEYAKEKNEPLKLVGEQIILSSRSDRTVSTSSSNRISRPHSALLSRKVYYEHKPNCSRPKSAECNNLKHPSCRSPFKWPLSLSEHKLDEEAPISVSHFTGSSSKFLQDLIETPSKSEINLYDCVDNKNTDLTETRVPLPDNKHVSMDYVENNFWEDLPQNEVLIDQLESLKFQRWVPEGGEEKSVRFMGTEMENEEEKHRCHRRDFVHHQCHHSGRNNHHFCRRREVESPYPICPHHHIIEAQMGDHRSEIETQEKLGFGENMGDRLEVFNQESESGVYKGEGDILFNFDKTLGGAETKADSPNLELSKSTHLEHFYKETELREKTDQQSDYNSSDVEINETRKDSQKPEDVQENEKPKSPFPRMSCDSTYEEMVRLLQTLEEEDSESLNLEKKSSRPTSPQTVMSPNGRFDQLNAVYSYLEEVEKEDEDLDRREKELIEGPQTFSSPRLEELLNKNSVELAHEVLSLKLQVEDQRKGIKLLREALAKMKEEKKTVELEHQEALNRASGEAEALVQRHQKFIKQLLKEKKSLNETVSKLVEDLKSSEERHRRNLKAMEEKRVIEVKRAKEAQAVADKIKREKWMESKTQKIKEMTVKGLEPELSRMAVRQQEELTELRNLQRAELEAVELRAARRTSELMDELRAELTKEKEHAIGREIAALRASMEKEFEEERNKLQNQCQLLKDRLRREEEKLSNREMEFHQKLLDFKQEAERERQKINRDHQEKLEELRRRHSVELKNLRESLEAEKEIWANNYKKQQATKFFERETELHQQYKKERDRDIELIIETLEKESAQIQQELNMAGENKLKRLKDKLEAEIKEMEASEAALKGKLSETKSQLLAKDDFITELNTQIRQFQTEITFLRKSCEEMTSERASLKELIRGEFESSLGEAAKEREDLEREIVKLKEAHLKELSNKDQLILQGQNEMQRELAKVCSRFKLAVSKKEKTIESLRGEIRGCNQRCQELEMMLDRQRRNLLL